MMDEPLAGITVVALEQAVAGPYCTARLADAGARVIKIERREGDFARDYDHVVHGESAYFVWLNRGKQSIALDLKDPDDGALLGRMIARADVFVQNLAPGAAARAGFAAAGLRERHPRLITCDITGYGDDGPYRHMKAYDLLVQCEVGLAAITGSPDAPGRVGVSVADICCGMNAHGAILQALFTRERSGTGAGIAVSLFDGLADWMTVPLLHHDYGGQAPARVGLAHPTIAPYGEYRLTDRRGVVISIQNPREWRALCDVLGVPDVADDLRFATNVARVANRTALDALIGDAFSRLDPAAAGAKLTQAGIAFGFLNEVADAARHPHLRHVEVATPSGPVRMPAPPVRWNHAGSTPGPVPAVDADGAKLRQEFA